MDVSVDGDNWQDCCGDDEHTHFYLDDKKNEINKVQTNSFGDLVAARFVRVKVSTGNTTQLKLFIIMSTVFIHIFYI